MPQYAISGGEKSIPNDYMNDWAIECGGSYENQCFVALIQARMNSHMIMADNWFNSVAATHEDDWQWRSNNCTTMIWEGPCPTGYAQNHFHEVGYMNYYWIAQGIPPW
jgi:hypothetical protein